MCIGTHHKPVSKYHPPIETPQCCCDDADDTPESSSVRACCKWMLNQPQFDWTMGAGVAKSACHPLSLRFQTVTATVAVSVGISRE